MQSSRLHEYFALFVDDVSWKTQQNSYKKDNVLETKSVFNVYYVCISIYIVKNHIMFITKGVCLCLSCYKTCLSQRQIQLTLCHFHHQRSSWWPSLAASKDVIVAYSGAACDIKVVNVATSVSVNHFDLDHHIDNQSTFITPQRDRSEIMQGISVDDGFFQFWTALVTRFHAPQTRHWWS